MSWRNPPSVSRLHMHTLTSNKRPPTFHPSDTDNNLYLCMGESTYIHIYVWSYRLLLASKQRELLIGFGAARQVSLISVGIYMCVHEWSMSGTWRPLPKHSWCEKREAKGETRSLLMMITTPPQNPQTRQGRES